MYLSDAERKIIENIHKECSKSIEIMSFHSRGIFSFLKAQ